MDAQTDDAQPARDYLASRAQAAQPSDDWMRALARQAPAVAAPTAPAGGAVPVASPVAPPAVVDSSVPVGLRLDAATREPSRQGFFSRLGEAVQSGALDSLRDFRPLGAAVSGGAGEPVENDATYAQPLKWSDLRDAPGTAVAKAFYQIAHGAPTLAAGVAGGALGGAAGSAVPGIGTAAGALAGGAIGAGAMASAQALGPYYAQELRRPGATPDGAFNAALLKAGQDGAFSAVGWAAFGAAPFQGAVKNLLLQAFGVQPSLAVAANVARNVEAGQPAGQGAADAALGGAAGAALPAIGHMVLGAMIGEAARRAGGGDQTAGASQPASGDAGGIAATPGDGTPDARAAPAPATLDPQAAAPADVPRPTPFNDARGGMLPGGAVTRDPRVWERWVDEWRDESSRAAAAPAAPAASPTAASSGSAAPAAPVVLDRTWLLRAGDAGDGAYSMQKGGDAALAEVRTALAQGQSVTYYTDGKPVPIVSVDGGSLRDAEGKPWGTMLIATDATGKSRIEIGQDAGSSSRPAPEALTAATPPVAPEAASPDAASPDAGAGGAKVALAGPARGAADTPAGEVPNWFANIPQSFARAVPDSLSVDNGPLDRLRTDPVVRAKAEAFLNGDSGINPVQVSLRQLTRDGDIDAAVNRLASFVQRDAVKPDVLLKLAAWNLGVDVDQAGSILRGRLPSDAQIGAFAMLMNSAGREVFDLAQRAEQTGADGDRAAAIRAAALMLRLQGEWTQAGTEQGRALRARQLAWDARSDLTAQVQNIIANVGVDDANEVISRIAALDDPAKVPPFLAALRYMGSRQGLLFAWYNMLLSYKTVAVKLTSDFTMAGINLATHMAAERLGDGVPVGEAGARLQGYIGSMGEAIRAAGKAMKAGASQWDPEATPFDGLTPASRSSLLAHGMAPAEPGATTAALGYLRMLLPTTLISAADDFAKVWNYRSSLNGLAYRQAASEGLTGAPMAQRIAELLNQPTPELHHQAIGETERITFTEPLTGLAAKIGDIADNANLPVAGLGSIPVGRVLLPFVRTPANILASAYRMSPLALAFPSEAVRADLAASGARRDLALARIGLGTAAATIGAGLVLAGQVTGGGPGDPEMHRAWLAAGNQPYSVRIGDTWYAYRRIEPLGIVLGSVADTIDVMRFAHEQDAEALAASVAFGIGSAMLSRTYLSGLADFLDALHQPQQEAARYMASLGASMVAPQISHDVAQALDQWRRAHLGLLESVRARLPFVSQGLPPLRTIWGEPIPRQRAFLPGMTGSDIATMVSPFTTAADGAQNPIDAWTWDHRAAFPQSDQGRLGFHIFGPVQSFSDRAGASTPVPLSDAQLDRLKALAGNDLKDPRTGLGARDYLNALVDGHNPDAAAQAQWNRATDERRAQMVLTIVNRFRSGAKQQLVRDDVDLADKVNAGLMARRAALSGRGVPAMQRLQ